MTLTSDESADQDWDPWEDPATIPIRTHTPDPDTVPIRVLDPEPDTVPIRIIGPRPAPPSEPSDRDGDTAGGLAEAGAEAEGEAKAPAASLGNQVRSAARWSLVNTMVMRLGNFATGIVLARYVLGPATWGVYGIAQTVLLVLLSANELGVGLAIVRWEGDPRRFAPTVLTLSTLSSTLLYAALFALAPTVSGMIGSPQASGVLRVMCLCVILDGVSQVPAGFLTRSFDQRKRMVIDALNFVLSTAVTLVLAFAGMGAMAFAWGAVVGNVAALIGFCVAAPGTLRFGWDRAQARALLRFGLPLAGASLLALGVVNVDTLVVGSTLGNVELGFYVLAFNISGWPVRIISEAARRVSFAGFSRLAESPQALAQGFSRALGVLITGTVPLCVLLGVLAGPIVELVYGKQWHPASHALPWLMVLGLVRIGCELAYDCLVAIGRRRLLIMVQGIWLVVLIPVLIVAARVHGIVGVSEGHVLVAAGIVVPVFLFALGRGGISIASIARACSWPFLGGVAMTVVILVLERPLGHGLLALIVMGLASMAVYLVCVLPSVGFLRGTVAPRTQGRHSAKHRRAG